MDAFATEADLVAWLPADTPDPAPTGAEAVRVLTRASEVIADHVTGGYVVDATGAATEQWVIDALRDATCAQVEQWLEVGEDNDFAGYGTDLAMSGGGLSTSRAPVTLAPRARRILRLAGLTGGVLI